MSDTEGSRIAVLETKMDFLAKQLDAATDKIDTLTATLNQVQGGWRTLGIIATAGGVLAGTIGSWLFRKIGG